MIERGTVMHCCFELANDVAMGRCRGFIDHYGLTREDVAIRDMGDHLCIVAKRDFDLPKRNKTYLEYMDGQAGK